MRRCVALLAAVAVALTTAASASGAAGPLGLHSMLQLNTPRAYKESMFAAAASAGAAEIRVDVSLGALNNPWIGAAMWQGLDDYMALSQQYAMPVLLDFNASTDVNLQSCPPGVDPALGVCGVSDLAGYYSEIAQVVAHVRGVIDDFEVVNEPDGAWAFSGTPQQYAGMLATAYNAVHHTDPAGRVLLGGIMTPADTSWLAAVFTTPGFDAAHAFDIANIHLRDTLANLPGDVLAWRRFFTLFGDGSLPLWVTETGYPADPVYQYDPAYRGSDPISGAAAQAAYLAKALPTLLFAGASRVFVTEHDSPGGPYASEGLLAGGATEADQTAVAPVPRLAWTTFTQLCSQYANVPLAPPAPLVPASAPDPAPAAVAASRTPAALAPARPMPASPAPKATPGRAKPAARAKPKRRRHASRRPRHPAR